jgi:MerR family transcriptional regulator, light-induced transcriptional regulator
VASQLKPDRMTIGAAVAELSSVYPRVTQSSLRFLEREGLIAPARSPGGHRLYSAADIARVRQIKFWQSQHLSLDEIRDRLSAQMELGTPEILARQFLDLIPEGSQAARELLQRADTLGMPVVELFDAVIRPAMIMVGDEWANGALRVGQEHEATEVALEVIAELAGRHAHPSPTGPGPSLLAACVAGEQHDLGLRMIVARLRAEGLRIHFLGADVDSKYLLAEVEAREPVAILLSATSSDRLSSVRATAVRLQAVRSQQPPTVIVGGQIARTRSSELRELGIVTASSDDLRADLQFVMDAVSGHCVHRR